MNLTSRKIPLIALAASAALIGCGGDDGGGGDTGEVQVFVEPEDTISGGLLGGAGDEEIADGWTVTYTRFLITVGNVRASRSDTGDAISDPAVYVLDLLNAPAGGYVIKEFSDVAAARWDRFGFDLPNASAGVQTLAPTAQADVDEMVQNGWSVLVEGSLEKADGQSCPPPGTTTCVAAPQILFRWGLPAGTAFDDCASEDGFTGFAVPAGGAVQVKPTIHGDHWFFNNFTAGVELTQRYAQYIADSDLSGDGLTTVEELQQVSAADVFPSETYNLSGAVGGPIDTAYDFVVAQARTLGDYQGDGECPTRRVLP